MATRKTVRRKSKKPFTPKVAPPPLTSSNTILNDALADLAEGRKPAIMPTKAEVNLEWQRWNTKIDAELSPLERKRVRDLGKLRKLVK